MGKRSSPKTASPRDAAHGIGITASKAYVNGKLADYTKTEAADQRYAAKGSPIVYTSVTIVDNNEDNSLAFSSDAHAVTMVRDVTSDSPSVYTATFQLKTGTVALTSDIPSLSGYAQFDFATIRGALLAVKAAVEAMGGTVTNFPAEQSQ